MTTEALASNETALFESLFLKLRQATRGEAFHIITHFLHVLSSNSIVNVSQRLR